MTEEADSDNVAVIHDPRIVSTFPWRSKNDVLREIADSEAAFVEAYVSSIEDRDAEIERLFALYLEDAPAMAVRVRLEALGKEAWPGCLAARYDGAGRREVRDDCVAAAIGLARDSEIARKLGVRALADRSWIVRVRAHKVLAYSLDAAMVRPLRQAISAESKTVCRRFDRGGRQSHRKTKSQSV